MPVREILVAAARSGRRDGWRILAVAITVSTVTAAGEVAVSHLIDPRELALSILVSISAGAVSILGTVFLSGFLTRLAGAAEDATPAPGPAEHATPPPGPADSTPAPGPADATPAPAPAPGPAAGATTPPPRVTLGQVARSLPWGRLILADLLVVVLVIIGILALVIPGLVILTLLAVTGPVIEIEDRKVLAALRRSARLARHHFWSVALLATVPMILASEVESIAPEPTGVGEILEVLAVRGIGEGVLEAAIGLILVRLCYRLIALDRQPAGAPSARTS